VAAAGVASALVDVRHRRIPNALTASVAASGVALGAVHATGVGVTQAMGGLAVGLLLMLPGFLIGATGGGDVKLFAAFGSMLGPARTGTAFLYTALAGAALAIAIAWRRKHLAKGSRFAYAPAIAVGTLLAALGL